MKTKHSLILSTIFFAVAFCFLVRNIQQEEQYNLSKREIRLREIGHEILLHSGDSTSRILPVEKVGVEKYRLRFEKRFTFEPESLVRIVKRSLASNSEDADYIVNVKECSGTAVVYGYSISAQQKNDIIPCGGRKQPTDCYMVTIQFQESGFGIKKYAAAGSLLAIVILFPVIVFNYRSKRKSAAGTPKKSTDAVYIGSILFDKNKKCLIASSVTINLTVKETRLLSIFAESPNQIINRSRLQKEIWEDDGIIVGRSLDVFISKLRKKLEIDAAVQLINIHGKGYKLQIGQHEE